MAYDKFPARVIINDLATDKKFTKKALVELWVMGAIITVYDSKIKESFSFDDDIQRHNFLADCDYYKLYLIKKESKKIEEAKKVDSLLKKEEKRRVKEGKQQKEILKGYSVLRKI